MRSDSRGPSVQAVARRVAAWWSNDPMTAHFSAERERDAQMLCRRTGRA